MSIRWPGGSGADSLDEAMDRTSTQLQITASKVLFLRRLFEVRFTLYKTTQFSKLECNHRFAKKREAMKTPEYSEAEDWPPDAAFLKGWTRD